MALELARMVRGIWKAKGMPSTINESITRAFANQFTNAVEEGFGQSFADVDYTTPDGEMLAALQKDIYHFSSAKNYTQLQQLSQALTGADGKLVSWPEFKQLAFEINNTHVTTWLKAEYNTAVASAQMAASWVRIMQSQETLPMLEFDAVMDMRTSELCSSLNGVIKPVKDAFWNVYYPPNHFNCRSDVRQHPGGRTMTPNDQIVKPDIPKMFQANLAQSGNVFPPKHPYYTDLPPDIKTAGERLKP